MSEGTDVLLEGLTIGAGLAAGVIRIPRTKCQSCGRRRVLFQVEIAVSSNNPGVDAVTLTRSHRLCARCAGIH